MLTDVAVFGSNAVPLAAQAQPEQTAAAGLMFLGFVILFFILLFALQAIFIYFAAVIVGLRSDFGTAFKAAVIAFVWQILVGILNVVILGPMPLISTVLGLLALPVGIMVAYEAGFFHSVIAAVLTTVLVIVTVVALAFGLAAVGVALPVSHEGWAWS